MAVAFLALNLIVATLLPTYVLADEQEPVTVGRQVDGRVVVPTNQILMPAGKQVAFPGRPVDLALTDDGQTLVAKNLKDLVFIDRALGDVQQTLASPAGFSVVGLLVRGGRVYATDVQNHLRIAARGDDGRYVWGEPIELRKPKIGGAVHPAGIARQSDEAVWVTSTRGNTVQLVNVAEGKVEQEVGVGVAPYAVISTRPERCYVTNWGGDAPKEGELRANKLPGRRHRLTPAASPTGEPSPWSTSSMPNGGRRKRSASDCTPAG